MKNKEFYPNNSSFFIKVAYLRQRSCPTSPAFMPMFDFVCAYEFFVYFCLSAGTTGLTLQSVGISLNKRIKATKRMAKINVQQTAITLLKVNEQDYISLTDIARHKSDDPTAVIGNWMRNRNTIEYLGIWETLYNPGFNPLEFEGFRKEAGLNAFTLSPQKWINTTGAVGIVSRSGRYGGTFAHKDIAFKFASWISVEFELYLVKEFQRLKEQEQAQIGWNAKRELSKINYRIHTDAIRQNLIPQEITLVQASRIYANEADVLNMALFGMTALEWRDKHPDLKGNIRDYASINELICLSNMESLNAVFIQDGIPQRERLIRLNRIAIQQMQVLEDLTERRKLLK